ncbi:DNA-binding LytR/AlgR family response regulator [Desulfobaculum xiamenense]|uniref:DNA-binding LytR/AlgR family response regulator n=1 Tax=Desulfobaculum xiamenense TaxID=995050 RepID=A0A846QSM9_9BACT|nr:LytTR family DNA-binding domain-containing protein [Desulfobaculum xiamenense]NJB68455.1 DNA-binding LytR/AlgR family response regulator [Desulfobaculum xiamenense]
MTESPRISAIIVDDEPPARDELAYMLSRFEDVQIVAEAASASSALVAIAEHEPDVVFLDIEMPGRNGFHVVAETLDMDDPPLFVFATAFDQYAIRAFEANAVDYLLKPVSEERLQGCVERLRQRLAGRGGRGAEVRRDLERVLEGMGMSAQLTRVAVEQGGRVVLLAPEDVVLVRAEGKKVMAYTHRASAPCHGGMTLDRLESRLARHPFFRANRGALVNLSHVREFSPWFHGKYNIVLDDAEGTEVTVSRSRVGGFKERLGL